MVREQETELEMREGDRLRRELQKKHPDAIVCVEVRIFCNAIADTGLHCELEAGHSGRHYLISKDHYF